ncbi:MAG: pyridoxamine 5'-phosphate oxidase family protein [Bacteroidaceae bacterium]|nr:pyridoxamine 5'-phosphate oxidase family protein [Bacteroidaceae bacterium]
MLQTALDFLKEHNEIAFATCEGNLPKIRIFQIMKQEGTVLYFSTSAEKAVWKELMQNPNVEMLAYADNISVRCSGMVNFDVEDAVKRWIYEHNPVLPRLYSSYDQLVYFCLPIAELDYFDLTPSPPLFKHFDLMVGEMGNGFVGTRFKHT